MREDLYTVETVAERLKLHPKTVLRAIREGRLRASRVGKSYRIQAGDLAAFAGVTPPTPGPASITAIVDLPGMEPELAKKWAGSVVNALNARPQGGGPLRADVIYEPERAHLKIVVVGDAPDAVNLLNLIRVWMDQLRV